MAISKHVLSIILCLILFLFAGCNKHVFIFSSKTDKPSPLIKKVAIAQFTNRSIFSDMKYTTYLYQAMAYSFDDFSHSIRLMKESSSNIPTIIKNIPRILSEYVVDNSALVEIGKQSGLNAIITGSIHDILIIYEKKGIYGFRKEKPSLMISGVIEIYDCETASKLVYHLIDEKLRIDPNTIKSETISLSTLPDDLVFLALSQLSKKIAKLTNNALAKEPWKTFIINKNDSRYIIGAGQASGLNQGDILDVIACDQVIRGLYDQQFYIPGKSIAQLQLLEVNDVSSVAIIKYGNPIEKYCSIRYGNQKTLDNSIP